MRQLCLVILCGCAAISAHSSGADDVLPLHPLSPPPSEPRPLDTLEHDGHEHRAEWHRHRRVRRQAYNVYRAGDTRAAHSALSAAESGAWGQWSAAQPCSRTCGGGVLVEERRCGDPAGCVGASKRYVSCNVDPCEEQADFRAEQCEAFDNTPLEGLYYHWLPYTKGRNKCELACRPADGNFYYIWSPRVVDGTKCGRHADDVCVEGVCLPVGCDGRLGSNAATDKCLVCQGDGSTCKTTSDFFDERDLAVGYHDVIVIPEGATTIMVEEMRPSSDALAIRNSTGGYVLNGNFRLQLVPDTVETAGTVFSYEIRGDKTETISAKGPTTEQIVIAIAHQSGSRDAAIRYEYSVPVDDSIEYVYKPRDWQPCSVTCGKGVHTRQMDCYNMAEKAYVHPHFCENNNATVPVTNKTCVTVDCEPMWTMGDWEECTETCGDNGVQYRVVHCTQTLADGRVVTRDDEACATLDRPAYWRACNRFACPQWRAGKWSMCSAECGQAIQYRSVTCVSMKEEDEGTLLPASACPSEEDDRPVSEQACSLPPCEGLHFITGDWQLCSRCNDTTETRTVKCEDEAGTEYELDKCVDGEVHVEPPKHERKCTVQPPCDYRWHTSEWGECSTECGHGQKTRAVFCAIHQGNTLNVMADMHCDDIEKPHWRENCTSETNCTGTWYTTVWSQCSASCEGGTQRRMAVCLNYDKMPAAHMCDQATVPALMQACNEQPCPTCADTDFGCCPDNATFADGPFLEGCSNCSMSEFGCCPDNYTTAEGPGFEGCAGVAQLNLTMDQLQLAPGANATYVDDEDQLEGSGQGDYDGDAEAEASMCEVFDAETNETASVPCLADLAETLEQGGSLSDVVEQAELLENATLSANETLLNDTLASEPSCAESEHRCCPDWVTPAEGPANLGCPEFELGECNDTRYGCCPDEVTLARGDDMQGCGSPQCSASLYGCCDDRMTIAFGTHFEGCDRTHVPCEQSEFGCCPDGETAALGAKGQGCGEPCKLSAFGCCPDMVTKAKGPDFEGCGCGSTQYGCCADGRTVAKGPSFAGCPRSCTQAQYGCCPDGETTQLGPNREGCPCQYTTYGCCPDRETPSLGPDNMGCDDCRRTRYGCCQDGLTKAMGPEYEGCPATTPSPLLVGGTVAPSQIVACGYPSDSGTVINYVLRYYYDGKLGECRQFWYGGGDGNDNNFNTKDECEMVCIRPPGNGKCYLAQHAGNRDCNQYMIKYSYDASEGQCKPFYWNGCGGNANQFDSWEHCDSECHGIYYDGPLPPLPTEAEPTPFDTEPPPMPAQPEERPIVPIDNDDDDDGRAPDDGPLDLYGPSLVAPKEEDERPVLVQPSSDDPEYVCMFTADTGECKDFEDKWYYDAYSGKCSYFVYGGCGGNANRFDTREECWNTCGHIQNYRSRSARSPACKLPMAEGTCDGAYSYYYYETAVDRCIAFTYSGCGGNDNRFETEADCRQACMTAGGEPFGRLLERPALATGRTQSRHAGVYEKSAVDARPPAAQRQGRSL